MKFNVKIKRNYFRADLATGRMRIVNYAIERQCKRCRIEPVLVCMTMSTRRINMSRLIFNNYLSFCKITPFSDNVQISSHPPHPFRKDTGLDASIRADLCGFYQDIRADLCGICLYIRADLCKFALDKLKIRNIHGEEDI